MTLHWSTVEVAERMTAADFWRDAPETHKTELIDGFMHMASPALEVHERLFAFLFALLRGYAEEHNLGEVRGSRTAVELADDQVYEPDILFLAIHRLHLLQRKGIVGAPDLVVEILSASTAAQDRGAKFRGYERAGVRELWLIDLYGPTGTEFFTLVEGRFRPVTPAADGTYASVAIPGFRFDTHWLWPIDRFIPIREALARIARA